MNGSNISINGSMTATTASRNGSTASVKDSIETKAAITHNVTPHCQPHGLEVLVPSHGIAVTTRSIASNIQQYSLLKCQHRCHKRQPCGQKRPERLTGAGRCGTVDGVVLGIGDTGRACYALYHNLYQHTPGQDKNVRSQDQMSCILLVHDVGTRRLVCCYAISVRDAATPVQVISVPGMVYADNSVRLSIGHVVLSA